jgi:serine protease Do
MATAPVTRFACLSLAILLISAYPHAQSAAQKNPGALDAFSSAVEAMAQKVSPSVVQILVARYGVRDPGTHNNVLTDWEQSIGSGVIVAPDGYIITNAHVVERAQQIRVRLVPSGPQTIGGVLAQSFAAPQDATLVGTFAEADLALLKIKAEGLPVLPIADFSKVRQGQVVFAFGSPQGLQNSMTMGVVSSIARQLDPDNPMLYIQTDAPINPGSSGGPLVNTAGEMVGLDTFISTQSGGNEGIGFALPGILIRFVFDQLRTHGHVHRPVIGAGLQTVTPTLAAALKLPRASGVLVSDVLADSPAAAAGLKLDDLLLAVDNRPLDNVAAMTGLMLQHVPGAPMKVQVQRGNDVLTLEITPVEEEERSDRLSQLTDLTTSVIAPLGIMAVTVDEQAAEALGSLRLDSGAVVVARTSEPRVIDIGLQAGDVIHQVNRTDIYSVDDLRTAVSKIHSGDPVAIQVERVGRWFYLAFEMP